MLLRVAVLSLAGGFRVEKMVSEVEVKWIEGFRLKLKVKDFPEIMLDEPPEMGGTDTGPCPVHLLAASVASCLLASYLYCAKKARVKLKGASATARAESEWEKGRMRVKRVMVGLELTPAGGVSEKRAELCASVFRQFCIVTESVTRGLPVEVEVKISQNKP
ncbi:MAG: OsmC family protein [Candidatus Freyarchaeota archaeon]|nr:OsmC family protein [Candidatus Jordarchaeia archaeon]